MLSLGMAILTFLHPSVAVKVISLFNCDPIHGYENPFLKKDYSVQCWDTSYMAAAAVGVTVLVTYIFGLPLFYFRQLTRLSRKMWKLKDGVQEDHVKGREVVDYFRAVGRGEKRIGDFERVDVGKMFMNRNIRSKEEHWMVRAFYSSIY